jgi:hypothetical protein
MKSNAYPRPDTAVLARGSYTRLALKLNLAMDRDADARRAYAEIWGEEWAPLPCPTDELDVQLCGPDTFSPATVPNRR